LPYLIAAIAAPVAGPLLYRLLHGRPRAARALDRFVFLLVPVLVAWQILPEAWERRSPWPLLAVGLGVLLPAWVERASRALAHRTDTAALAVGLSGLVIHSLLEGAALAPLESAPAPPAFALAVTLHRIAEGLVVWWLLRPRYGTGAAVAGVGLLLGATCAGFVLGLELLAGAESAGVGLYQALVAGSLVHVVFHQGRHDHTH
jgi:zinc transporter ZupT